MSRAAESEPTVFVVDDDEAVGDAIGMLLRAAGLRVELFADARSFLRQVTADRPGCLILDVRMPDMSGVELQDELRKRRYGLPILFLTAHADVPMAVRALKRGAFDFIEKPHEEHRLVLAASAALRHDGEQRQQRAVPAALPADVQDRLRLLSQREKEVLELVLEGRPTRAIAEQLSVSVKTIEFHRSRIREKLGAGSLAQLFGLFITAGSNGSTPDGQ